MKNIEKSITQTGFKMEIYHALGFFGKVVLNEKIFQGNLLIFARDIVERQSSQTLSLKLFDSPLLAANKTNPFLPKCFIWKIEDFWFQLVL